MKLLKIEDYNRPKFFGQFPKQIFKMNLKGEVVALYIFLYDRWRLSASKGIENNSYYDKELKSPFVVATREELMEIFGYSQNTVKRIKEELIKLKLIHCVGNGKRVPIKYFITDIEEVYNGYILKQSKFNRSKNDRLKQSENDLLNSQNLTTSNTNSNTNLSNTNNIYSQVTSNEEPDTLSLTSKNNNSSTLGDSEVIQLTKEQLSELIQQQVSKEMTKQQEEKVKQEVDDIEKDRNKEIREKVVEYFNRKCDTKYKNDSKQIKELVNGRISEGYTLEDFLQVIDNKCNEWKDTKMQQYLRPSTLFRKSKFEEYLNSVQGKMEVKNPYMKHYELNQQESDALDELYGVW